MTELNVKLMRGLWGMRLLVLSVVLVGVNIAARNWNGDDPTWLKVVAVLGTAGWVYIVTLCVRIAYHVAEAGIRIKTSHTHSVEFQHD